MQPPTRSMQHGAILVTVAGALALAAVTVLNLGAVPSLPAKIVLGVSLPAFYGAALCTITPASRAGPPAPEAEDEVLYPSEIQRVRAWRRASLDALGVPEEVADVLDDDPSFSVHELQRLLAAGCPLGTALRILWPA